MEKQEKESFLGKIILAAVPTIVGAMLTAYFTNRHNEKEFGEEKHELSLQLSKSLDATNSQLNRWVEKYEDLSGKYSALVDENRRILQAQVSAGSRPDEAPTSDKGAEASSPRQEGSYAPDVNGAWMTPDNTIAWSFNSGKIEVGSSLLPGFMSGTGVYSQRGKSITGSVDVNQALFQPVNYRVQFTAQLNDDGRFLTGTARDPSGIVNAVTLHR